MTTFHFVCPDGPPKQLNFDCPTCETDHRYPKGCHFVISPNDLTLYPLLHTYPGLLQAHSFYQGPAEMFQWPHPLVGTQTAQQWNDLTREFSRWYELLGQTDYSRKQGLRTVTRCTYHPGAAPHVYVRQFHAIQTWRQTVTQHFKRNPTAGGLRWLPILRDQNTMTQLWKP